MMLLMAFLTLLIPLIGIVLGIIDLTHEGKRKTQGAVLLALGIGMTLVHVISSLLLPFP